MSPLEITFAFYCRSYLFSSFLMVLCFKIVLLLKFYRKRTICHLMAGSHVTIQCDNIYIG